MAYELPDLPYGIQDLAPHISAETLEYHHGKHHNAYVLKLNELLDNDSSKNFRVSGPSVLNLWPRDSRPFKWTSSKAQ